MNCVARLYCVVVMILYASAYKIQHSHCISILKEQTNIMKQKFIHVFWILSAVLFCFVFNSSHK